MGCNSSRIAEPAPKWFEDTRGEDSDDDATAEDGTGPLKRVTEQSEMTIDVDSNVVHFSEAVLSAGKPSISVPSALTVTVPDSSFDNRTKSAAFHIVNDQESVPVFFKVKVTHPSVLTFKPNAGRIEPSGTVIIAVSFNAGQEAGGAARQPRHAKAMIQTLMVDYTGGDRLPNTAWSEAPPSILGQNVMKIDFEDTELEEEIDFSKFKSVTMTTRSERAWWK